MHDLVEKFWQKYLQLTAANSSELSRANNSSVSTKVKEIFIAYSGGLDSRVLLELCCQALKCLPAEQAKNYQLQAIHINHGLQQESDLWQQHCSRVCQQLQVHLHQVKVKIPRDTGESIEALARTARRVEWERLLPQNANLLLAHHQDDQAETLLYRLFRGAGVTGLGAMAESCAFGKGKLLRPLLTIAKSELEQFAKDFNLQYITDPSNSDAKFDRNFIRHKILPALQQRWPQVAANISRSASLCREQTELVAEHIEQELINCAGSKQLSVQQAIVFEQLQVINNSNQQTSTQIATLSVSNLLKLPIAMFNQVMRLWLKNNGLLAPSKQQLNTILQEVLLAAVDANPRLKLGNYELRRYRDDLYVLPNEQPNVTCQTFTWKQLSEKLSLTKGKALIALPTLGKGLVLPVDAKELGLTVCLGSKGKKAKKIFQKFAIPPWERHEYPLIFYKDSLLAVVGLWSSSKFAAISGETGLILQVTADK